jgi:hypothetical protein
MEIYSTKGSLHPTKGSFIRRKEIRIGERSEVQIENDIIT